MRRITATCHLLLPALMLATAAIQVARAQSPPPGSRQSAKALEQAIRQLTAEAEQALREARIDALSRPDVRARFQGGPILESDLVAALTTPQHREPFIDAYIRWQLTSFDPAWPDLDDHAFARFMDRTPRLLDNPRADPNVLDVLRRAESGGPLAPQFITHLRADLAALEDRTRRIEAMNRPAIEFRAWVAKKLGDTGPRPRQWMIEELAARIIAGWDVSDIKAAMTRNFTASVSDQSFTPEQREMVYAQLLTLRGRKRVFAGEVTFLANGAIRASESTAQVTNENLETWRRRLAGEAK